MIPEIPVALTEYFIERKGWRETPIWLMWHDLKDIYPQLHEKTTVIFNQYPSSHPFRAASPVSIRRALEFQPMVHLVPAEGVRAFLWRLIPQLNRQAWWYRKPWRNWVRSKLQTWRMRGFRDLLTYAPLPTVAAADVREYPWKWYTVHHPYDTPMIPTPMYSLVICYVNTMDMLLINTGENR